MIVRVRESVSCVEWESEKMISETKNIRRKAQASESWKIALKKGN